MISTTGKLYYTPEELEKAKEHASALEYAIDKYGSSNFVVDILRVTYL